MTKIFTIISLLVINSFAEKPPEISKSDVLSASDLGIEKFEFKKDTSKREYAIMRLQTYYDGKLVRDYEEIFYQPKSEHIGNLLVFKELFRVKLPNGEKIPFTGYNILAVNHGKGEVLGVDDKSYATDSVTIKASAHNTPNTKMIVHFYSLPKAVVAKHVNDLPSPQESTKFSWIRRIKGITRANN